MAGENPLMRRRDFLRFDDIANIFRGKPLTRGEQSLRNALDGLGLGNTRTLNIKVPTSLAGEATFSLQAPEPQGVGQVTNLLPVLQPGEEIIYTIGGIVKKILMPIAATVAGYAAGVLATGGNRDSLRHPTRRNVLGGAAGAAVLDALLACGILSPPDNVEFVPYDSDAFQRTTAVNVPLSINFPPDTDRTPHANELLTSIRDGVRALKPDVSLPRTRATYSYSKDKTTLDGFVSEIAYVPVNYQKDHVVIKNVVNGEEVSSEHILEEIVFQVAFVQNGKVISTQAIWSEIPDQDGETSYGLHLVDENGYPDFTRPLIQMTKKANSPNIVHEYFFDGTSQVVAAAGQFSVPSNGIFDFGSALALITAPLIPSVAEASGPTITPLPLRTLVYSALPTTNPTATPTQIATATATATLEPTRAASPTPTTLPTYDEKVVGLAGVAKIENKPEWKTIAQNAINQYAKVYGVQPETVKLNIKGFTDTTGNQFALGLTQDGIPLMIWENGEWKPGTLQDYARVNGKEIGTTIEQWTQPYFGQFDLGFLYYDWTYGNAVHDNQYRINTLAKRAGINHFIMGHVLDPRLIPPDIAKLPPDQKIAAIKQHAHDVTNLFGDTVDYLIVANEPHAGLTLEEVIAAFQGAKDANKKVKLGLSETANYYPNGAYTQETLSLTQKLKEMGLIDFVAVEGHDLQYENEVQKPYTSNDVATTLDSYDLEIVASELDFNTTWMNGTEQQKKYEQQAQRAYTLVSGLLKAKNVKAINFWGADDKDSWLVKEDYHYADIGGSSTADPLLYHNGQPKPIFYSIGKAFIDNLKK